MDRKQKEEEQTTSDDPQLTIDHVNPHDEVVGRDGDDLLRSLTDVKPRRPADPAASMEDNRQKVTPPRESKEDQEI
jgi:hypothetical protein